MIESCQARTLVGATGGGRSLPKAAVPSKGWDLSSFREITHEQQGEPHRRMASWGITAHAPLENMPVRMPHVKEWWKITRGRKGGDFSIIRRIS